jgi:hypothetical protein
MATNLQPLPDNVPCSVCGKQLDPRKPLGDVQDEQERSLTDEFYCLNCWFRELRSETAESLLARAQDRVLLE